MAVNKLLMDQFTPVTVPTAFEELMESLESVSRKSPCGTVVHKQNMASEVSIWETTVSHMHIVSHARHGAQFVTHFEIEAS
jgi:hypothetical protein